MRRYVLALVSILSVSDALIANTDNEKIDPIEAQQQLFQKSLGATGVLITKTGEVRNGDGQGKIDDTYMDTVIYNDLFNKSFHRGEVNLREVDDTNFQADGIKLATPKTKYLDYMSKLNKAKNQEDEKALREKEAKKKEKPKYFVGGYCSATQRTEIIKASSFNVFDCMFDFGNEQFREISVFAGVYPNYKKELLIGLPIYVSLPDGSRASMRGIVMSADKTSLNIANEVESYKIRRWVAKYGLTINNIAYKYAMMYMNDLRLSKINQEITYVTPPPNGDGTTIPIPVQTTQVQAPDATEMLKMAGVELLGKLVALGTENLLEDSSPLFTLYKGQRVWIEGIIDTDYTSMKGALQTINTSIRTNIKNDNSQFANEGKKIIEQGANTNIGVQLPTSNTSGLNGAIR